MFPEIIKLYMVYQDFQTQLNLEQHLSLTCQTVTQAYMISAVSVAYQEAECKLA